MSNLCGRRVGVLAAGGGGDAVSLKDLLSVLQHGLIAELQVELETDTKENIIYKTLFIPRLSDCTAIIWVSL